VKEYSTVKIMLFMISTCMFYTPFQFLDVVCLIAFDDLSLCFQLHQLLPAILTMVVAQRLSSKSFDNHWILRYEAALCLVQACNL
jgi:hypothetical protein